MQKIAEDYYMFSIPKAAQTDPRLLLATSGVLNTTSGRIQLFISSVQVESDEASTFDNVQRMTITAKAVFDNDQPPVKLEAFGAPSQCYQHLIYQFEQLLKEHDDSIYLQQHRTPSLEELMDELLVIDPDKADLSRLQKEVDDWIQSVGVNYFSEMTNLSNLIEEVGEVARLIGREYGEQSFKPGEKPDDVHNAIGDEMSDVLFVLVCLANQMGIDLTAAFAKNMQKKTQRDATRHANNPSLARNKE